MAIYKNIDGTTKSSFKIGKNTISFTQSEVIDGQETLMKVAIKEKDKDPRYLVFDDEISIPKTFCSGITQNEAGTETTFKIRTEKGEEYITVKTHNVGVKGPSEAVAGNLAAFKDNTGQEIMDAGVNVSNSIEIDGNSVTVTQSVPSVQAVVDYVGDISEILARRVRGQF